MGGCPQTSLSQCIDYVPINTKKNQIITDSFTTQFLIYEICMLVGARTKQNISWPTARKSLTPLIIDGFKDVKSGEIERKYGNAQTTYIKFILLLYYYVTLRKGIFLQ